jgi:hypothetical protein
MLETLRDPAVRIRRWSAAVRWALVAIVLFAIGLRLTGLGFLLPYRTVGDSQVLPQEVELLRSGRESFDRGHALGLYPNLLPRLALLLPNPVEADSGPVPLEEHLARASRVRFDIRIVIALASVLAVPATYLLARRFLEPAWSLLAAAWVAASFLLAWFAQQERPHAAAASFYVLTVVAALALRERPRPATLALACLGTAASLGSLQSGIFVVPSVLAALWLADRDATRKSLRFRATGTLILLVTVVASVRFFYPFLFDAPGAEQPGPPTVVGSTLKLSGHSIRLDRFNGGGAAKVLAALWSYEPLLLVLAAGGALVGLRALFRRDPPADAGRWRDLAVVAAHAVPYLAAILLYEPTRQRFLIPLLPYAAVLAAACLRAILRFLRARSPSPVFGAAAGALVLALPTGVEAACSCRLASVRAAPDTIELAAEWIRSNVRPAEERIALSPELDLPLLRRAECLRRDAPILCAPLYPWFRYQCGIDGSTCEESAFEIRSLPIRDASWLAELESAPRPAWSGLGCRYVVLEVFEGWGWKAHATMHRSIPSAGKLVARFDPDPPEASYRLPIEFEDEGYRRCVPWLSRILRARSTGPPIEIYRLDD